MPDAGDPRPDDPADTPAPDRLAQDVEPGTPVAAEPAAAEEPPPAAASGGLADEPTTAVPVEPAAAEPADVTRTLPAEPAEPAESAPAADVTHALPTGPAPTTEPAGAEDAPPAVASGGLADDAVPAPPVQQPSHEPVTAEPAGAQDAPPAVASGGPAGDEPQGAGGGEPAAAASGSHSVPPLPPVEAATADATAPVDAPSADATPELSPAGAVAAPTEEHAEPAEDRSAEGGEQAGGIPPEALAAAAAVPAVTPLAADAPLAPVPLVPVAPAGDEPPDEATAATDGTAAAPDPSERKGRRWLLPVALTLLAGLALGGTGFLAWQAWQREQAEDAREEGLAAARDAARLLFSYDHDQLEEDFRAGLEVTTGDFREDYERTTREVVTPVATEYDAVVQAEVVEAAVVTAEPDRLVALVFLNQTTTSTRVEGPKIDQSRVRMTLVERDGEWLVTKVDAL